MGARHEDTVVREDDRIVAVGEALGLVEMESLQFVGCSWFMGLIGLVFKLVM
jgi:hypothetical protein